MKTGQFSRQKKTKQNTHWNAVKACQGTSTNRLDSKQVLFSLQNKGRKDAFPPQRNLFQKLKEKFTFLTIDRTKKKIKKSASTLLQGDIVHER